MNKRAWLATVHRVAQSGMTEITQHAGRVRLSLYELNKGSLV